LHSSTARVPPCDAIFSFHPTSLIPYSACKRSAIPKRGLQLTTLQILLPVMSRLDMSDFAEYGVLPPPKSTTTRCPRRQKSKHACESCKLRKRKCDGNQPCYMCERYEYDCHYAAQLRRKRSRPDERVEPERNGSLEIERLQPKSPLSVSAIAEPQAESPPFLEANSTLRFAQVLRNRLNPNERPSGLHDYAWNLGLRLEPEEVGSCKCECAIVVLETIWWGSRLLKEFDSSNTRTHEHNQ
jgi:hypothetical protein